jgi:hypothetical protein
MQTRTKADEAPRLAARAGNTSGMTRLQQLLTQQPVDGPSVAELLAHIRQQSLQVHGQPAQIRHTQTKNSQPQQGGHQAKP